MWLVTRCVLYARSEHGFISCVALGQFGTLRTLRCVILYASTGLACVALRCVRKVFTQDRCVACVRALRCVLWKPGLRHSYIKTLDIRGMTHSAAHVRGGCRIWEWRGDRSSAESASIEALQVPRGWGLGRGMYPSATGRGLWRGCAPSPEISFDFQVWNNA